MINYYETTRLRLDVSSFERRGLTASRMLTIVRSMPDTGRGTSHNLCATMSSGQYELIVQTWNATREGRNDLVRSIELAFEAELKMDDGTKPAVNSHCFKVTPTDETGLHSGRRRYRVECATCNTTIHPGTTGVQQAIDLHERAPGESRRCHRMLTKRDHSWKPIYLNADVERCDSCPVQRRRAGESWQYRPSAASTSVWLDCETPPCLALLKQPIEPLAPGRVSLKEQAAQRGLVPPVGMTVAQLIKLGYDVDLSWPLSWIVVENPDSPTGLSVGGPLLASEAWCWALAT